MKQRNVGLILSYLQIILNTVLGLFMSSFVIDRMGATDYGVYQMMSSFASYLALLQFGTGTVMTRNIAKLRGELKSQKEIDESVSTVYTISMALSAVLAIVSAVFYFCIDGIYTNLTSDQLHSAKEMFIFISVHMIVNFMLQAYNGIWFGYENFLFVKTLAIVRLIIRTAIVVLVFCFRANALSLVLIDFVIDTVVLVITAVVTRIKLPSRIVLFHFSKAVFKTSFPLAMALLLQTIVNQANNTVGKFIIGVVLAPEIVTVYSIGMFIFNTYSSVSTVPISIYLPNVVKNVGSGLKEKELAETLIQPSRLLTVVGGTIMFGFVAFGQPFIELLYGAESLDAYYVACMVMLPMFINMSNGILVNVLDAMGKRLSRSLILVGTTVLNIGLTILMIQPFGMIGAAASTAICTLLGQVIIMNIYYCKVLKIPSVYILKKTYTGLLPALLISCAVTCAVTFSVSLAPFVELVIGAAVYLSLMALLLFWFGLNEYERDFVAKTINKIKAKVGRA